MKHFSKLFLAATFIFAISCSFTLKGFAAVDEGDHSSCMVSLLQKEEHAFQIDEPIIRINVAQILPNGNIVLNYVAINPNPIDANVPYQEHVALMDSNGNMVWETHTGFLDEEELNISEGFIQFVVNQNSFTYESYMGTELQSMLWVERGFDGEGIDFSKELVVLADHEKRLVTNLYPFRVENYGFGEQENDRALLKNLQNGTETEIASGGSCFRVGATIFAFVEHNGALCLSVYDENCVRIADRTIPVTHADERVAGVLKRSEDVCIMTTEYIEGQVIWRAYMVDTDTYALSRTAFEYTEERIHNDYLSPLYCSVEGFVFIRHEWDGQQLIGSQLIYVDSYGEMTQLDDMQLGIVLYQTEEESGQITLLGYDLPRKQCILRYYFINSL